MNIVILSGRLTRDPELKFGQSGMAYSRFSVAVDRPFQSADKNAQTVDFINCVAFGKTAEFIGQYFRKGKKILINGKLQMSQYESEGKKVTSFNVIVDLAEFADGKGNTSSTEPSSYGHTESRVAKATPAVEEEYFDVAPSDDMPVSTEIDDEFPF